MAWAGWSAAPVPPSRFGFAGFRLSPTVSNGAMYNRRPSTARGLARQSHPSTRASSLRRMGRPRDRRSSHAAYRPKIVVGQSMKLGCFLPTVRDGKCAVPSEVTHHELGTEIGYGVDRAPKGLE